MKSWYEANGTTLHKRRRTRGRGVCNLAPSGSPGGRRGVPRGRPVRSPDRDTYSDLLYAPLHSRILYTNCINQQISPCFLQDLLSKVDYHQMQRSYEGVKLANRCEIVTVSRHVPELGPKWLQLLPSCSLSITEVFPTFGEARQASGEPFVRCEHHFTPPPGLTSPSVLNPRAGAGPQSLRRGELVYRRRPRRFQTE